jgi:fumarylpyruvate hydrolase
MDKILCLGKNFPDHAQELGEAQPAFPVVFSKFPSVLQRSEGFEGKLVLELGLQQEVHHECEIVLEIGSSIRNLPAEQAWSAIKAISVGLDLTDRPLQAELKKAGQPWTLAKNFPGSAVVGPLMPVQPGDADTLLNQVFSLSIDGMVRQQARLNDALFGPGPALAYLSRRFQLLPGDLVFMGTPVGVGQLLPGQRLELRYGDIHYGLTVTSKDS